MYLIKNAKVYAPEDLGDMDVLTGGGQILKMGKDLPAETAYGVEVIDGTGKVLMPGLIDAHVHILGGGGEGGARTRTPELALSDVVSGGVTTVVGCLGTDGCTRTMENLLAKAKAWRRKGSPPMCILVPIRFRRGPSREVLWTTLSFLRRWWAQGRSPYRITAPPSLKRRSLPGSWQTPE